MAEAWKVELLVASDPAARERAAALAATAGTTVFDTLREQVTDLAATRRPGAKSTPAQLEAAVAEEVGPGGLAQYGVWAWYPWSRRLVRLLPKHAFWELRSDRNRHKILREEQATLRTRTIGVIGLSVGQSCASTLVLEGVCGKLKIADFDTLALSNLNRLRAGVHELGLNKAVITARSIAELDPFVEVEIFEQGITEQNLDGFLAGLDLLVEECDDLWVKVKAREAARARRIPVIMDTNERGMMDIERFDLEPERPVFHGLLPDLSAEQVRGLASADKVPYVLGIIGIDNISAQAAASMCEVDESLSTWPQLGSAVTLGAALVTDCARRILLDQHRASGRFFVDLAELLADGRQAPIVPKTFAAQTVDEAKVERDAWPILVRARAEVAALRHQRAADLRNPAFSPTAAEIRYLVAHATLAPSGGNIQPWLFSWDGQELRVRPHPERARTYLDWQGRATWLAVGAAVESLVVLAPELGLQASCELRTPGGGGADDESAEMVVRFARREGERDPLAAYLTRRVTNRRLAPRAPLAVGELAALSGSVAAGDGYVRILDAATELTRLGEWLAEVNRMLFLEPTLCRELMGELRWNADEVARTLDGVDLATLDLTVAEAAVMRVLAKPGAMGALAKLGGGGALRKVARKAFAQCSGAVLVGCAGARIASWLQAGRNLQRVWLAATQVGLAVQPWTPVTFLLTRYEQGASASELERQVLGPIAAPFRAMWQQGEGEQCAVLLRLAHAPAPSALSLRRDVSSCLELVGVP